jgi:4-amino-4-deoxy-L-arabinose transferase-like glycosyltransferase
MLSNRQDRFLALLLFSVILLRLISFGWLAEADPTESRYAEVAKQMYESHDWVTPRLYIQGDLVPYWGKPPLHFWFTSASFELFGVSEWSSRLPSIIAGLIMLLGIYLFASRIWNEKIAWLSAIILASSGLFFVLWGASVVDVTLSAAVTIGMISFPFALEKTKKFWGISFFACLALATLTKGLVAPAIAVVSIGLWWLLNKRPSLRHLPWFSGSFVYFLITVPWFVIQETRTPGFLKYFIVNEHLLRFLMHDYGDKYGSGHMYPHGTIWGMLIVMYLPWTIFLAIGGIKRWKSRNAPENQAEDMTWFSYVCIWGLTPAIFFTFSRQILGTYLLPGFGGLAIATAVAVYKWTDLLNRKPTRRAIYSAAMMIPLLIVMGTFLLGKYVDENVSVKPIFTELAANHNSGIQAIIFPFFEPPSADFYEDDFKSVKVYRSNDPMKQITSAHSGQFIVVRTKQVKNLPVAIQKDLQLLEKRGIWTVYVLGMPRT